MNERGIRGEKARHHLIDPRTGESAQTDWLSVTVLAPDVITADVYAKAILIGGKSERGLVEIETRGDLYRRGCGGTVIRLAEL